MPVGPVAVLGHEDLGRAPVGRLGVVDLVAVDEHHDVGVLLDASCARRCRRPRSCGCPATVASKTGSSPSSRDADDRVPADVGRGQVAEPRVGHDARRAGQQVGGCSSLA